MRLAMFNELMKMKLFTVADTRFASAFIILRRFKTTTKDLQDLALSDQRTTYRNDDAGKTQFVKERVLNDLWWDMIKYIISFINSICAPTSHLSIWYMICGLQ